MPFTGHLIKSPNNKQKKEIRKKEKQCKNKTEGKHGNMIDILRELTEDILSIKQEEETIKKWF